MEKKLSQKVFEKIDRENIKIRPYKCFLYYSIAWLFLSGAVFVFSSAIFVWILDGFYRMKLDYFAVRQPVLFFHSFPFLPVLFFLGLIFLSGCLYRKSRTLCRHENWMLYLTIFIGLMVVGVSFRFALIKINEKFLSDIHESRFMRLISTSPKIHWSRPNQGTLAGEIIQVNEDKSGFMLYSFDGENWKVDTRNCDCEKEIIQKKNGLVRIFGKPKEENCFEAIKVWQWE